MYKFEFDFGSTKTKAKSNFVFVLSKTKVLFVKIEKHFIHYDDVYDYEYVST